MDEQVIKERYLLSMERIRSLLTEETVREPYRAYFRAQAELILLSGGIMEESAGIGNEGCGTAGETGKITEENTGITGQSAASVKGAGAPRTLTEWRALNHRLYADILPEHYETSFANPAWAVRQFGEEMGRLLCFLAAEIRGDIVYSFEGRLLEMVRYNEALIEIYNLFEGDAVPEPREVKDVLYWCISDYCDVSLTGRIRETLDPAMDFAKRIVTESDLNDLTYLYRLGVYVSPEEERLAAFLNTLPEETIGRMADTCSEGYIRGFAVMGRDLSKKKSVVIRYPVGLERMVRRVIENFEAAGLSVILPRAAVDAVNRPLNGKGGYDSSSPNKQYDNDHRYDSALFMDKAFRDRKLAVLKTAYEEWKKEAGEYAGPAVIETFGEPGFTPVQKPEAWAFTEKQQKLYQEYRNRSMAIMNEYIPGDETSFTIIAFPVPAIGPDFEKIFEETIRINTLDYTLYQKLQQRIIDVLDTAEYAEVTGAGDNETRMHVNLAKLTDPERQTKFENCVADVNIPLGEVFTSPVLTGTEGILHVKSVYIGETQFRNLKMRFRDGRVQEVSCDNFLETLSADASEAEREQAAADGRKLVIQTIMNGNETLPIGEFAIGTNTTAYVMAERFGILDRLPILIVEKMGPHFAVGDTCYSWSEDSPMYNPDGKEMIARDNEISILRKEDVEKAYFGVHTDITIPYRELASIAAVHADGTKTMIIEDGRFVMEGLAELNRPFAELG